MNKYLPKTCQFYALTIYMLFLLIFSGCASRGEIKRFQQQLDYLTKTNAEQERGLKKLDSLMVAQQEILRQLSASQQYNMEQLQTEMSIIEQIFKESGYQVTSLSEKIEGIRKEITVATQYQDSSDTSQNGDAHTTVNAKQIFETAQLDFNKGKFELAKMGFEQFVSIFPNSTLTDDAEYYIAECLDELGKYQLSRRQYLMLGEKYPESNLVAPALFKAASISIKMDDVEKAKKLLQQIIEDYPLSSEAELAKEKQKSIGEK